MHRWILNLATACCCLFATPTTAQDFDPYDLLPEDSLVVAEFSGLGTLRNSFGATNLGELITGNALKPLRLWLEMEWEKLHQIDADSDSPTSLFLEAIYEELRDHSGRVYFGLSMDLERETPSLASLIISDDGETDLQRVHEIYRTHIADLGYELRQHEFVGRKAWYIDDEESRSDFTFFEDGNLVFCNAKSDVVERVRTLLETSAHPVAPSSRTGSAACSVRVDLTRIPMWQSWLDGPLGKLLQPLGFAEVPAIELRVTPNDERLVVDCELTIDEGATTLFDCFRPPQADLEPALAVVPGDAAIWVASCVDWARVGELVRTLSPELMPSALSDFTQDDIDEAAQDLGTTFFIAGSQRTDVSIGDFSDLCIGLQLNNASALEEHMSAFFASDDALRARLETNDYRDQRIHTLGFGNGVHFAVVKNQMIMAAGDGGLDRIHAVVDADGPSDRRLLGDGFTARRKLAGDDCVLMYNADFESPEDLARTVLASIERRSGLSAVVAPELVTAVCRRMRELDLLGLLFSLRFDGANVIWRTVW